MHGVTTTIARSSNLAKYLGVLQQSSSQLLNQFTLSKLVSQLDHVILDSASNVNLERPCHWLGLHCDIYAYANRLI